MKVIKTRTVAVAAALVMALTFASCSNSSDDSAALLALASSSGSSVPTTASSAHMKAEAVAEGIKFTLKGGFVASDGYVFVQQVGDVNRFIPDWGTKSEDWTGVYPFVTAGKVYKFMIWGTGNKTEELTVKAIGGSGDIKNGSNASVSLQITPQKITATTNDLDPALIFPAGATNKKVYMPVQAGEYPNGAFVKDWIVTTVLDGANATYELPASEQLYTDLKTAFTTTHTGKKAHIEFAFSFTIAGFAAECHSTTVRSPAVLGIWE